MLTLMILQSICYFVRSLFFSSSLYLHVFFFIFYFYFILKVIYSNNFVPIYSFFLVHYLVMPFTAFHTLALRIRTICIHMFEFGNRAKQQTNIDRFTSTAFFLLSVFYVKLCLGFNLV